VVIYVIALKIWAGWDNLSMINAFEKRWTEAFIVSIGFVLIAKGIIKENRKIDKIRQSDAYKDEEARLQAESDHKGRNWWR
jgi:hypothetical protein